MHWKIIGISFLVASLILTACLPGSIESSTATTEPAGKPPGISAEPTTLMEVDAASDERGISEVSIPVEGLELAGSFYAPEVQPPPWPGVILLHMLNKDRTTWDDFAHQLSEAGYAALSIDLRGHGETGGEMDWDFAAADLKKAWDYLVAREDIVQDQTAIVGGSIGANLAVIAGANENSIRTVVLLSPGLSYSGVETEAALKEYGTRPLLIIASRDDSYAADSSSTLDEQALGDSKLIMYETAGHGTNMLQNEANLSGQIIDWLDTYLY